jgi:hypothetical protein
MQIRLKDIIDLDYFIHMDEAKDSPEEIQSQTLRDRNIYNQCKDSSQTESTLLLTWLAFRKDNFFKVNDKKGFSQLPGTVFSILYSWMINAMILTGGIFGISLAYSFLAYHGNRPINVTILFVLFVLLQVLLILITLIFLLLRSMGKKSQKNRFDKSIIHTLISSLFFDLLPKIMKKTGQANFKRSFEPLEYTSSLIRIKQREYKDLFFWPIFILASIFAFSFSAGALGGTFFRVIVSDMAFGWQSTLMASSERVYDLVSFTALPWSWFAPESLAHPTLAQIEGSRIVLKDGISILATQDLASWWPFICLGILFYAVIPRGLFIITGIIAQKHVMQGFNFKQPRFNQIIVRMQSPVLDIDSNKKRVSQPIQKDPNTDMKERPCFKNSPEGPVQNALLLISKTVYSDEIIQDVVKNIETQMFFNVKQTLGISFDFEKDVDTIRQMSQSKLDQVILVHEVWQPPIRGLLHYIQQIKTLMPDEITLCILLTQDAGLADLFVDKTDINYKVWKKAVFKLENPYIVVKRFMEL